MSASFCVRGALRLALTKKSAVPTAAAAAAKAIPIWGRILVIVSIMLIFFALCSCVVHIYNMSALRHIPQNHI